VGTEVVRDDEAGRYLLRVDGHDAGFADFVAHGEAVVELPHTVIDPDRRGQGLAAVLIGAALDDILDSGRKVLPTCSYVAAFIGAHPDYRAAVAGS
jgi:predicted GNAT family acetyltransferase